MDPVRALEVTGEGWRAGVSLGTPDPDISRALGSL